MNKQLAKFHVRLWLAIAGSDLSKFDAVRLTGGAPYMDCWFCDAFLAMAWNGCRHGCRYCPFPKYEDRSYQCERDPYGLYRGWKECNTRHMRHIYAMRIVDLVAYL